jgi:RHS repeat-associated protein
MRDITAWPYYASGGYIGIWSMNASSAYYDDFGGGTMPGSSLVGVHVKASLVKMAHKGNAYRKALTLQAPPAGQVWRSYYFQGSVRLALRVQVNGAADKVYYLLTDHLGSTSITVDVNGNKQAEIRYKPWGETRYTDGNTPTDYLYTGQRAEFEIGLYFYQSRFYDANLGRFSQPDSIIPEQSQGVQAWDRYGYVKNNPVRYADPTGHDVGCSSANPHCADSNGLTPKAQEDMRVAVSDAMNEHSVETNSIVLKGGPGSTTSYGKSAEDSWTGFSGSGQSTNPKLDTMVNGPQLANDGFVFVRDNTNARKLFGGDEVSGKVYYEVADQGWNITGVRITNFSRESIAITSIRAAYYSIYGDNKISSERLYPSTFPSIQSPNYGTAKPGFSSGVVKVSSGLIPNWNYVNISIHIKSKSGRFGDIGVSLSINPPDY